MKVMNNTLSKKENKRKQKLACENEILHQNTPNKFFSKSCILRMRIWTHFITCSCLRQSSVPEQPTNETITIGRPRSLKNWLTFCLFVCLFSNACSYTPKGHCEGQNKLLIIDAIVLWHPVDGSEIELSSAVTHWRLDLLKVAGNDWFDGDLRWVETYNKSLLKTKTPRISTGAPRICGS